LLHEVISLLILFNLPSASLSYCQRSFDFNFVKRIAIIIVATISITTIGTINLILNYEKMERMFLRHYQVS